MPGILFLHGGPHTAIPAAFSLLPVFLATLGYAIVMPNYR